MEEEIIDKDFTQSYWLVLQFWVQPNRIFTVGVPQASHGKIQQQRGKKAKKVEKVSSLIESVQPRARGAFPLLWRWDAPPPKPDKMSITPEPRPYKRP